MSTLRAFVSLSPPCEWHEHFATTQREWQRILAAQVSSQTLRALRWVAPEKIHLTLLFLAEVEEQNVNSILAAIQHVSASTSPFDLQLGKAGSFSSRGAARVLWLGLENSTLLNELQSRLSRELGSQRQILCPRADARSFEPDRFAPHLTLARVRKEILNKEQTRKLSHAIEETLPHDRSGGLAPWRAESIELMQSNLTPNGSQYSVLAGVAFSETP